MKLNTSFRTSFAQRSAIRDPVGRSVSASGKSHWVPAFAGMTFLLLLSTSTVYAVDAPETLLHNCLKKADDLPDVAVAEAEVWLKHGGGPDARLCRAVAQFNRNEFASAAADFALVAKSRSGDPSRAARLHGQAGLAYTRAGDNKKAEDEYGIALKLEPQDPDIWIDRAVERASSEHYWDAVADLNQALAIMPDTVEALKIRGQVWMKLGMKNDAEEDFEKAAEIEAQDTAHDTPAASDKQ